jgi:hypothetical protein
VFSNGTARKFRHSATYTDARIGANPTYPGDDGNGFYYPVEFYLRADSSFANGYGCSISGNGVSIFRIVANTSNTIASGPGVPHGLPSAFSVAGSVLRVSVNGIQCCEVVDTTYTAAGFCGVFLNDDGTSGSGIGPLAIETPYADLSLNLPGKNVTRGLNSSIGIGYLGAADIALIAQSVLATLNANTIPVDVQRMNNAEVIGTGTTGDAWRGVGVSP